MGPRGFLFAVLVFMMASIPSARAAGDRVIVLGFDGASADLVERWMDDGTLPHLARLRQSGTFSPLLSTNPPQSPIAWASFAAGVNPGKTNQFDFLERNPADYSLDLALAHPAQVKVGLGHANPWAAGGLVLLLGFLATRYARLRMPLRAFTVILAGAAGWWVQQNVPPVRTQVVSAVKGTPFWEIAAARGIQGMAIDVPNTFPPHPFEGGTLLSGLGVPDMRGTIGTYTIYTTDGSLLSAGEDPELGGKLIPIRDAASVDTYILGPTVRDGKQIREVQAPLHLEVTGDAVTVRVGSKQQTLHANQWSDWFDVEFRPYPLFRAMGICRFYLKTVRPDVNLYMSPVNFHPAEPPTPISYPKSLSAGLKQSLGYYKTLGWKFETWALNQKFLDEKAYLQDADFTMKEGEDRLLHFMSQGSRLYVQVFSETDTTSHMFWRLIDPQSPSHDPQKVADYGEAIRHAYQRMDDIVGQVQSRMSPDDVLLVVSDHGFAPYRRAVNLNRWLADNGFMAQTRQGARGQTLENLFILGDFWPDVDWSQTKAYAFGLGQIYVNLQGREGRGSVPPSQYDAVCDEVRRKLLRLEDPQTGAAVIAGAWKKDELYKGPYVQNAPDLRVAFHRGYRVSWQDSMGGIVGPVVDDNRQNWSGDHCSSHPDDVRGILFCSRKLKVERPAIIDIAPTVLRLLDVPVPADMDGRSLW